MNEPDYSAIAKEIAGFIDGDVSVLEIDREKMARDTSLFYVKPEVVIYPKNTSDISKILKYVSEKKKSGSGISVTMRAAGTCMTGGPLSTSIVVDTTKYMNKILSADKTSATAEPGVFYRDFEKETLKHGWLMPSYPASRDLAAIGGMVSNNAGGEKTLTYGKTEDYIKSLEVVYANGETDTIMALREEKLMAKYKVKSWDAYFPQDEYYQVMHIKLFPKKIVHAENLGGDINKLSNKRVWIGCFPLKGIELESAMCRIVALLPKTGK